jgi:hypothetical protein
MWLCQHFDTLAAAVHHFGGNYFDMSPLAALFGRTDVDDVNVNDIELPFPAFYIHFGESAGLNVLDTPGFHVEGAYICYVDDGDTPGIAVMLTCNFPNWERASETSTGYIYGTHTLTARAILLRDLTVGESVEFTEGLDGDPIIYEDHHLVKDALRMVVNSLLYVSTPKADIQRLYPADAPIGFVEKADRGNLKAERTLRAMGFTRTMFCGREMAKTLNGHDPDRSVEPHWRRGHWRRVAHGEGRSERRWHWFLPVVVNAKLGLPKNDGRVYEMQETPQPSSPTFKM